MITVENLTCRYGDHIAVAGVDLVAPSGAITVVLGREGAGKSTLLRAVAGRERPTSGHVTVAGVPVVDRRSVRRLVGATTDETALLGAWTARRHLMLVGEVVGTGPRSVDATLARVGLADTDHRTVGSFSAGMRSRLAVASALLGDPVAVVLDEPELGLDDDGVVWLRGLLQELARDGRTVLVSSHTAGGVVAVADQVVALESGRVRGSGPRWDAPLSWAAAGAAEVALTRRTATGTADPRGTLERVYLS